MPGCTFPCAVHAPRSSHPGCTGCLALKFQHREVGELMNRQMKEMGLNVQQAWETAAMVEHAAADEAVYEALSSQEQRMQVAFASQEQRLMEREQEKLAALMRADKAEAAAVVAQNELVDLTKRWGGGSGGWASAGVRRRAGGRSSVEGSAGALSRPDTSGLLAPSSAQAIRLLSTSHAVTSAAASRAAGTRGSLHSSRRGWRRRMRS